MLKRIWSKIMQKHSRNRRMTDEELEALGIHVVKLHYTELSKVDFNTVEPGITKVHKVAVRRST